MAFWNRSTKNHLPISNDPQPKRISTPAGQRLSIILENGSAASQAQKARDSHRTSVRKSGLSLPIADGPRDSLEDKSQKSSGYSYSVWSDGEKFAALRNNRHVAKRGGWRKLAIILAIVLAALIALGVGLGLGLKRKNASSDASGSSGTSATDPQAAASASATSPTSPTSPTSTASPSSIPSDFPKGSYSFVTFLDTVQTNCTSNAATWSCYPYTTYYTDVSKSVATFNWIISGSPGAYKVSSTENPFSISIKNADLELLDEGKDTERYRFQLSQTKTVSPATSLTDDNAATQCDFANTNLQAYLYTKMAKGFPDTEKGDPSGNPTNTGWPFAVRVEQVVGGGENVPNCYTTSNGQKGDQITMDSEDEGSLCSCLYKNWHTPF